MLADIAATDQGAFLVVAVLGTIAFATSGVLAAAETELDWLGATVLAVVVAIGGGTIRDILIGNFPVTWVNDEWPVIVALCTVALGLIVLRLPFHIDPRRQLWYLASDAVGLGAFVVLGTSIAIENGTSSFIAIFMGVKAINRLKREEAVAPSLPPSPSPEETLLTEIRDLLKSQQNKP